MKKFTCVQDIGNLKAALDEAFEIKKDRFKYVELGRNKTLMMIFFNSSLRTRLSTQKAATNLGMNVIVLDINQGAWKLETERGVIMDGDKPEHLLEAIPVMGCYCDIIGVRSFARFENKEDDYNEVIINQFIQHSGRPVFSMEAATRHPLQSFADLITIEEYKKTARPKVVMTWAPHPRPLPQAVPNSFAEWMNATDYDFVITHPEGYELAPQFVGNARVEYDHPTPITNRLSTDIYSTGDPYILVALKYIHQNLATKITVEDVVRQVPLSRRLLEIHFKQVTGSSIYQYIFNLRMERFSQLLLESSEPIADIAMSVGLSDYKNLARQFKLWKKYTPAEYRKIHRVK